MIFFDLEFYVPLNERNNPDSKGSLVFNPTNPTHFLLGGYFTTTSFKDLNIRNEKSLWIWNYNDEKALLKAIYDLFIEEYFFEKAEKNNISGKRIKDLITCGFAIGRVDLVALFIRSQMQQIDLDSNLFNVYLKTKLIDLSNIATFIFPEERTFYPKTANEVNKKLFPKSKWKESGKSVWKYYDQGEYDQIEQRCQTEVEDIINIYKKLQQKLETYKND